MLQRSDIRWPPCLPVRGARRSEAWRVNPTPSPLSRCSAAATCLVPPCTHLVPMILLVAQLHVSCLVTPLATVGSHAWDPAFAAVNPCSALSRAEGARTGRSVKAHAGRRQAGGCGLGVLHCNHAGGRVRNEGVVRTFRTQAVVLASTVCLLSCDSTTVVVRGRVTVRNW